MGQRSSAACSAFWPRRSSPRRMAGRSAPTQTGARTSPRRHPSGGRITDTPPESRWPLSRRWTLLLIVLAVLFAALRGIHALAETPEPSLLLTDHVVVVGVTGRPELTEADRTVLAANLESAQVGSIATRGLRSRLRRGGLDHAW